jgi:SAM-dependent methyltransferase
MRITLLKLLERLTSEVDFPEPVYEFGAFRVPGQRHLPTVRSFFPGQHFVGCDLEPGPGVDEIQDLHHLALPDGSIGTALMFDTIEHVRNPWQALAEVRRCLKPGGILVMTSVWYFPIHAYPDDYWRFTGSAFRELWADYTVISVDMFGLARLPHTVVGVASHGPTAPGVDAKLRRAVREWGQSQATTWKELAIEIVPPRLFIPAYAMYLRLQDALHRRRKRPEAGEPPSRAVRG